jgi:hypothetical protein
MATKLKKNYSASDEVPQELVNKIKQDEADKADVEKFLKDNPDVTPAPAPYKTNAEYLKEEAENREKMLRNKRYSDTMNELMNPPVKKQK